MNIKTVKKTTTQFKTEHMTGVCCEDDSIKEYEKFFVFAQTWNFEQLQEARRLLVEMVAWAERQRG